MWRHRCSVTLALGAAISAVVEFLVILAIAVLPTAQLPISPETTQLPISLRQEPMSPSADNPTSNGECSSVSWCFTSGSWCFTTFHYVSQCFTSVSWCFTMFNNVLRCLVSHATIGFAASATSRWPIASGITTKPKKSAITPQKSAMMPQGSSISPRKWSHAKLRPEWRLE